jgi:hypothetical protein
VAVSPEEESRLRCRHRWSRLDLEAGGRQLASESSPTAKSKSTKPPKYWKQTLEQQDTQKFLAANPFRKISTRS